MINAVWSRSAVLYEMNLRQATPEGTLAAAAERLGFLRDLGIDAVWLMPHYPIGEVGRKGSLGSYYSIRDYRAVDPELGTLADFDAFVDKDWINNWKEFFHQFYVDDILIVPSWEEVKEEDKDKMILHIDPGTAFGTGMHETTQLVIRQLKKFVTKDTQMLDVGTGSGILGIVALKLGAAHVVGTDLDPCAIPAVADNKAANGIKDETFDMLIGNIIDDKEVQDTVGYEKYDIVTANILADVLVPLTPVIVNQMKKGAYYITSGILDVKEEVVVKAVQDAGLQLVEVTHQGEWVSVTARKE